MLTCHLSVKLLQHSFCVNKTKTELKYFDLKYIFADRLSYKNCKNKVGEYWTG